MKKLSFLSVGTALMFLFLTSCGSSGSTGTEEPVIPSPTPTPEIKKIPISLNVGMPITRATDTGYESGDKIGLYVVNYVNGSAGNLNQSGNHVDNMSFTYSGTWTPATPIYWLDDKTHADFYCYYPYAKVTDITAHAFSIQADQSTLAGYKASEFLFGKKSNVTPTESAISITTNHLMSCAIINVAAGNGFTAESLAAAEVSVKLNNLKTASTINLATGEISATGNAQSITPYYIEGSYKALVVPQTVNAENFITVTVDGRDYNLNKEFTFQSGKRHTFTVTLSKTSNGVNVSIGAWEDDEIDNGGTAE